MIDDGEVDPSKFFESVTGNDPLDIPGFDLDDIAEEDVLSGRIVISRK